MDGVLTRIALGETPDWRGSNFGHNCRHYQVTSTNCQAASTNSCLKSCEAFGDAVDDRVQPNNQPLRNERSSSKVRRMPIRIFTKTRRVRLTRRSPRWALMTIGMKLWSATMEALRMMTAMTWTGTTTSHLSMGSKEKNPAATSCVTIGDHEVMDCKEQFDKQQHYLGRAGQ
ncbi:uncharacterized protein [Drosophila pseudoobscura]|uniref:Uncharacterized protein isoform X1 n=1 Tax=Drosophila pseudoobscura pseudoobscura TaxID=46245 RepID=A0A6I8VY66_DROPS|nr:uncharacterized protein LOC6902818 isoform X1 [Drosophila pseudoobscura]